ncbi:hypothetical protein LXL04_007275 [Taraxacum kok-saghyz]
MEINNEDEGSHLAPDVAIKKKKENGRRRAAVVGNELMLTQKNGMLGLFYDFTSLVMSRKKMNANDKNHDLKPRHVAIYGYEGFIDFSINRMVYELKENNSNDHGEGDTETTGRFRGFKCPGRAGKKGHLALTDDPRSSPSILDSKLVDQLFVKRSRLPQVPNNYKMNISANSPYLPTSTELIYSREPENSPIFYISHTVILLKKTDFGTLQNTSIKKFQKHFTYLSVFETKL